MTTDTGSHPLSPSRRSRTAARDTSTAARHAVLGLRIASTAPARWAVACALAVGHTSAGVARQAGADRRRSGRGRGTAFAGLAGRCLRLTWHGISRAAGAAGQTTGRGIADAGRAVRRGAGGAGRAIRAVGRGADRAVRAVSGGMLGGLQAVGRATGRAGRGFRRTLRRGRQRLPVWWPVAVCTLVGALGGAAYGLLKAPEYTATSYVMVTSDDGGGSATVGYAQAYGRIATGGAVLNRARTTAIPLDALESGVEAVTSPEAPMIQITGTSGTPRLAADMANRVAQSLTGIANLSSKDTGAELRVFSQAITPDTPASPSLPLSVAVGACTGGLLGALLLLVRPRRGSRGGLETVPAPAVAPAQDGLKKKETRAPAEKNAKEKVR